MSAGNGAGASAGESLISADNFAGPIVPSEEPAITEEELSGLDQRDRAMLRSIIDLDYTTVREVMVPRLDMVALEGGVSLKEAADAIIEYGHSRLPVYNETIDYVLGIVYVRDLLAAVVNPQEDRDLRSLIRPAFIVPETKRVDELLEEFRQRRTQIAIVVDEYGGTEGLVTMEDVLEEIVGEIEDEFSRAREAEVIRDESGAAYVSAGLGIEDVEDLFGVEIESDDFDTVAGFVYHHLGRVPQVGDVVENEGLRIEVMSVAGRRLRLLKISSKNGESSEIPG
jgi:CBS domain containing-hemolysin-like protein